MQVSSSLHPLIFYYNLKNILAILFFALSISSFATGEVVIKGNISGDRGGTYVNSPVQITIIEDFITNTKKVIAKGTTDDHGNYEIKFKLAKTTFAFLEFGKVERTLYIDPAKAYFVSVKAPLLELEKSHGFFAKDVRKAKIINRYPTEINTLVDSLEYLSSTFLYEHPAERKSYKYVKAFTDSLQTKFKTVQSTFFKTYLHFKTAELKMFVMRTYRKDFAKQYLDHSAGLADNIQSMHVFNAFFNGHMENGIQTQDNSPFHNYMLRGDLDNMLSEVYKTSNYNRELNELILLKGLFEISNSNFYRKNRLNITLDKVIATTAHPIHKIIAFNIKRKLNHLESGYPAPNIQIRYANTNFNLGDYKGKYVYLCFFKAWDIEFENEIKIINYLKERYEGDLEVVCIATDIDISTYNAFLKKQIDTKNFFHYNYNVEMLSEYRLKDFRVEKTTMDPNKYFLIGPQGNIIYNDAKSPSKGFEYDLRKIIIQ